MRKLNWIIISVGMVGAALLITVNLMTEPNDYLDTSETTQPVLVGEVATFATGCFWCMEAVMQETPGILDVVSGYAGGTEVDPTYEDVYSDRTGHREAVQMSYDPDQITYDQILEIYWQNIDPTDPDGQFVDRGFSYTAAIFYHDEGQQQAAEKSKQELQDSGRFEQDIVTEILPFTTFYLAEEYHQDFYKKSSQRYLDYSNNSGRKEFKQQIWEEIQKEQSQ